MQNKRYTHVCRNEECMKKISRYAVFCLLVLLAAMQPAVSQAKTYKSKDKKLSVTLNANSGAGFQGWGEYFVKVKNTSDEKVTDWKVTLTMNSGVENVKTWSGLGIKVSGSGKKITIKPASGYKSIAAGKSVLPSGSKFGYGGTPTAKIKSVSITVKTNGTSSASESATTINGCKYKITGAVKNLAAKDTPVGKHGKLFLSGTQLVDKNGKKMILRGASTHGIQWFPQYVNKGAFQSLRDEWGVNMVRLAAYAKEGGYTDGNGASMDAVIEKGVKAATELGMYVIIDWHVLAYNPNDTVSQAKTFFKKYAQKYKNYDNVIFEICNEPTNTPWNNGTKQDIESYASKVIPVIRDYTDAVVICGTNTWSQDVDEVKTSDLKGIKNVMYAVHFYSGTHGQSLRDKVSVALKNGTPVFCTEFGVCDASGNGGYNISEANRWIDFFEKNGISYCCWSLCNKAESASYLKSSCNKTNGGWTNANLTKTGAFVINAYRSRMEKELGIDTSLKAAVPKKGKKFTVNGYKYKITKSSKTDGTVMVIGSTNKKRKKIVIKDTVTIKGYKFRITAIGKKAFYKYKKAKSLKIGMYVTSIGKKAFGGCKNIKRVTVKKRESRHIKGEKYLPK